MSKPSSARKMGQSLFEFDRAVDEHAGVPQMFAATVLALREARAEAAAVDARREEVFGLVKDHFERGDRHLVDGRTLARGADSAPRLVRTVPSAVVKKCSPTLWEQAKVPTPFVQVVAPSGGVWDAVVPLPALPSGRSAEQTVAVYELLKAKAREAATTVDELVDRLKKIGANNGWDGMPIEFTDGWKVSLARMQYSSDRLAIIAPETFAALSVEREQARQGTVYIAAPGAFLGEAGEEERGEYGL